MIHFQNILKTIINYLIFFLNQRDDEAFHIGLINLIENEFIDTIKENNLIPDNTSYEEKSIKLFKDMNHKLHNDSLTAEEAIEFCLKVELSETNNLFLYIVKYLSSENRGKKIASNIIIHHDEIKKFITDNSYKSLETYLGKIPQLYKKRVLVVEDNIMNRESLVEILKEDYEVDSAINGVDGLNQIKTYHDVIISDMNMPLMDGKEFYLKSINNEPKLINRFIFYTGNPLEYIEFFKENHLKYLEKPSGIFNMQNEIENIIKSEYIKTRQKLISEG